MTRTCYDLPRWVTHDLDGHRPRALWPYFLREQDKANVRAGELVEVNACWNGIAAFDARWFTAPSDERPATNTTLPSGDVPALPRPENKVPVIQRLPSRPPRNDSAELPARLPLHFRDSTICRASECTLISLDMHRIAYPTHPLIYMNPRIVVGTS